MNTPIKEIRERIGLSQEEFGKAIGVGQAAISQYENGERTPNLKTAKNLIGFAAQHGIVITLDYIYELTKL
jgi:DNA-binding XRE family transcriptional regulator